MKPLEKFFIVGAGSVGSGMAWALKDVGLEVTGIWNRNSERFSHTNLPEDITRYTGYEAAGLSGAMPVHDLAQFLAHH